jgi:hypothetical protein
MTGANLRINFGRKVDLKKKEHEGKNPSKPNWGCRRWLVYPRLRLYYSVSQRPLGGAIWWCLQPT